MDIKYHFLNNFVGVDFETDNVERDIAEVIEEGVCALDPVKCNWSDVRAQLYNNTNDTVAPYVSCVNNITKEMIEGMSKYEFDSSAISTFSDKILLSHNSIYETTVIKRYMPDQKSIDEITARWFCTYRMARKLFGNDQTFENLQLSYLRYRLNLRPVLADVPHRAGYDAHVTSLLFEYIVDTLVSNGTLSPVEAVDETNVFETWFTQLINWYESPIKIETMPFGKHKGDKLEDVPESYWKWALSNVDLLDETNPDYDSDFADSVYDLLSKKLGV